MKYIKLFEDFPDFGPEDIGGAEHTKSWMSSMKGIDENVMKLRELMDSIREGEQKMKQLEMELGMGELKAQEKAMLEDIRVSLESIDKSSHKAHGILLKLRKGHIRWDSPSKEDILGILSVQIEGAKQLIEAIKADPELKKPVNVSPSIKATYDEPEVSEAEEGMPWYRRAIDKVKGWLVSLRRKFANAADDFESVVDELENAVSMDDVEQELPMRRPMVPSPSPSRRMMDRPMPPRGYRG